MPTTVWPKYVGETPPFIAADEAGPRARKCRGWLDDLFADPKNRTEEDAAKLICDMCPLRTDCMTWAVERKEPVGVWGATGSAEREDLRRLRGDAMHESKVAAARRLDSARGARQRRKRVYLMAERDGMTPDQIAARLGVAVSVIHEDLVRIRRALMRLRYPTRDALIRAACRGKRVWLTSDELYEAIDRLDDGARTLVSIAETLSVHRKTVERRRAARIASRIKAAA